MLLQYYANEAVAEQAWFGIINKIAHLIAPLMLPAPIVGTQEERIRRSNNVVLSKRSLIEYCMAESSSLLSAHKYQLAVPAAVQALKYSKDVDGEDSLTVVEPYLHLAHASLGLKQISQAEDYLSFARWIVLNTSNCPDRTRSRMHQFLGRVYTAKGAFDDAKKEFASCIFYSSRFCGAEAIPTASGYFRLGDVFLAEGHVENSLAFFDKVVDIWYKYLSAIYQSRSQTMRNAANNNNPGGPPHIPRAQEEEEEKLDEEYISDGHGQLEQILDNRRRLLGPTHIATGEAEYTIGLFEFFVRNNDVFAESFMLTAQKTYEAQLGPGHPSSQHVSAVLSMVQRQISLRSTEDLRYVSVEKTSFNPPQPQSYL